MSKQANPTLIGAFVLGAIVLAVGAIVIFSSGSLYKDRPLFVMYFDDSVKGLDIGSSVSLLGVQIGTVKEIGIIHDSATGKVKIPVIAEFHPETVTNINRKGETREENIKHLVEDFGLRAQLRTLSIVTGQLFIEVDYHPGTEYRYYGDGSMVEIPTIPSPMEQLGKELQQFNISELTNAISSAALAISQLASNPDLKLAFENLNNTLVSANKLVTDINTQIGPIADNANQALDEMDNTMIATRGLVKNINSKLDPLENNIHSTLLALEKSLTEIKLAAANMKQFSDDNSPTVYKLNTALDELARAAKSVRTLADTLERHPEAILQGKKRGR
ncbi:MlaD family protein [Kaarinaea lacus]